jgi:hypothetical protein
LGQIECGRFGFLQLGQSGSWTSAIARCERLRPFRPFDCLTFGSAMTGESYRNQDSASPAWRQLHTSAELKPEDTKLSEDNGEREWEGKPTA